MTLTTPHTTVVIVTYRSRSKIDTALQPLEAGVAAGELRVVVVDNASDDGTAPYIAERFPWARLVEHGGNFGFARGCNRGFAEVETPYTLFLNPDASLTTEQIRRLAEFMEQNAACGACAPALRNPSGGLQRSGMMLTPGELVERAFGMGGGCRGRTIEPGEAPQQTDWICGAAFMVRSSLYGELGMMDPRFFMYFEETDLCRRILDAGMQLWTLGEVEGSHDAGASSRTVSDDTMHGDLPQYYYPSRLYYLRKNHGWLLAYSLEFAVLCRILLRGLFRRLLGRPGDELKSRLRGGILRLPRQPT